MKSMLGRVAQISFSIHSMALVFLSSLACADSALVTSSLNGHTYKRFDTPLTWQKARSMCAARGGYLATVTSREEGEFLYAEVQGDSDIWLGGTDAFVEGSWRWITGEPWVYQNWDGMEPTDSAGGEDYLVSSSSLGLWQDRGGPGSDSSAMFRYICEWDRLYESFATISDVTGDAVPDYATLYREAGSLYLLTTDGATGAPIKRALIGPEAALNAVRISAASGNISVLLSRSSGSAAIQVRDEVTLDVTATVTIR